MFLYSFSYCMQFVVPDYDLLLKRIAGTRLGHSVAQMSVLEAT